VHKPICPQLAGDQNRSDQADIDLEEYERDADGNWHEAGSCSVTEHGSSWSTRIAATWGRGAPGETGVQIDYLHRNYSIVASATDLWLFVMPSTLDSVALPPRMLSAAVGVVRDDL
jgi:hypothetical protein